MPVTSIKPYLALTFGIICLGFSGIFVSWANAPGTVTGFYRMAIAAVVLAVPFIRRRQQSPKLASKALVIAGLGGLLFACDLFFYNTGVLMSGAVNPTLMGNTAPLWVAIGAMILFHERLGRLFWMGLGLAMIGAAFILGSETLRDFTLGLGTFFGLLAGMFYGGYYLITQFGRRNTDALSYFWIAAVSAAIILLLVSLIAGQPLLGYPTKTYLSFLGLGLVSQVLGQFSFSYSLGYLPASFVAPAGLGQPVVTAILVGPLLGQELSAVQIIGGLAVLTGVFLVHRSREDAGSNTAEER